jgi:mono/diheme cytochrome c family protein
MKTSTRGAVSRSLVRVGSYLGILVLLAVPVTAQKTVSPAKAKELFLQKCGLCHGKEGQPNAIFAKQGVRAFVDAEWQKSRTDAQIRTSILKGRQGTAMVSFEKELKPEEVDALLKLIRSFSPAKP